MLRILRIYYAAVKQSNIVSSTMVIISIFEGIISFFSGFILNSNINKDIKCMGMSIRAYYNIHYSLHFFVAIMIPLLIMLLFLNLSVNSKTREGENTSIAVLLLNLPVKRLVYAKSLIINIFVLFLFQLMIFYIPSNIGFFLSGCSIVEANKTYAFVQLFNLSMNSIIISNAFYIMYLWKNINFANMSVIFIVILSFIATKSELFFSIATMDYIILIVILISLITYFSGGLAISFLIKKKDF